MHAFCVREATASDAAHIAEVHIDSIRSLGVAAYDPELVADWGAPRTADRYLQAMANGELSISWRFFSSQSLSLACWARSMAAVRRRMAYAKAKREASNVPAKTTVETERSLC